MHGAVTSSALMLWLTFASLLFPPNVAQSAQNQDEQAVYAAVVRRLFAGNRFSFDTQTAVNLLVIKERTVTDHSIRSAEAERHWRYIASRLETLSEETISSFKAENQAEQRLDSALVLPIRHIFVSNEELDQMHRGRGWEEFRARYPDSGGFIGFSRIGFNAERSQALVYFEHWCGNLCGSGLYILLTKDNDEWKVRHIHRAWIS